MAAGAVRLVFSSACLVCVAALCPALLPRTGAEVARAPREVPIPVLERGKPQARSHWEELEAEGKWPAEVVALRIEEALGMLAEDVLGHPSRLPQRFLQNISPEFRGTALCPRDMSIIPSPPGLELRQGGTQRERTVVAPRGFQTELQRLLEGYARVRSASFRVTRIDTEPVNPRKARARVIYTIAGVTAEEAPRQDQGVWETEWESGDGRAWRLRGLESTNSSRAESRRFFFRDVTAMALGGNASYARQLSRGTSYWMDHLDAATQIDLYGLNGIAVGDYDGDGWEDVYVCQSGGLPNRLYRNQGDGTFQDVTEQAGLGVLDSTSAALWADYDNDGDQDLFVITASGILLFENDGRGHFRRSSKARFDIPLNEQGAMMMAALADYDWDGYLDLYVCQYSSANGSAMANNLRQPTPYFDARNGAPNHLFHNNGDGTFTDVTQKTRLSVNNDRWSFAASWADYNQDGYPDLYVANDFGRDNLYRNNGDGTFTDVAPEAGVENIGAGMSVAWGDYDDDGRLDVYISNIWSAAGQRIMLQRNFQPTAPPEIRQSCYRFAKGNTLFRNKGDGTFEDAGEKAGVENGGWAWSADFIDFNNDGWEDLFVVNGHISNPRKEDLEDFHWTRIMAASPLEAVSFRKYEDGWRNFNRHMTADGFPTHGAERKRFFVNLGNGTFADMSGPSGLDFPDDGRAFAVVDFDNDGHLDLIVRNRTAPQVRVLHNEAGSGNHVLALELAGHKSNRDAIGARVSFTVGAQRRIKEVSAGSGFLSQHTRRLYFGVGSHAVLSGVRIDWPSGLTQVLNDLPVDRLIRIDEGNPKFTSRAFRSPNAGAGTVPNGGVFTSTGEGEEDRGTWLLERVEMPKLRLRDLAGKERSPVEELRGSPALLNFWGGACTPCEDERKEWKAIEQDLGPGAILSVCLDEMPLEKIQAGFARRALRANGYAASPATVRLLNTVVRHLFASRLEIGMPLTLLLDRNGYMVKVYRGGLRHEWVRNDLARLPKSGPDFSRLALPFPGQSYGMSGTRLETYFLTASECLNSGLDDEALHYLRECLRIDPRMGSVLNNIGTIHSRRGQLDEALGQFERAAGLDPRSAEIRFNIGTTLAMKGRFQEAAGALEQAAAMDPDSAELWTNLGNVYLDLGRPAAALPALQRALQINPNSALVHNSLGILYGQQRMLDRAIEQLREAVRLQPDYESAFLNLGILYLRKQDRGNALNMFLKVLELNPGNAEARRLAGQLR